MAPFLRSTKVICLIYSKIILAILQSFHRAVIFLIHGMAEHCGRYDTFSNFFAREGFAVHAMDLQGIFFALFEILELTAIRRPWPEWRRSAVWSLHLLKFEILILFIISQLG